MDLWVGGYVARSVGRSVGWLVGQLVRLREVNESQKMLF